MKMTEANRNPDSDKKPKVMICPPGEAHVDAAARIGELFRKARIGDRNGAEVLGSIEGSLAGLLLLRNIEKAGDRVGRRQ